MYMFVCVCVYVCICICIIMFVFVCVCVCVLQCLVQLGHNLVCSGGRDLCLWDRSGVLLDKFDRSSLTDTSQSRPHPLWVT